jgi:hypothetical protein
LYLDQVRVVISAAEDLGEASNLAEREPQRVRALADELSAYLRQHRSPLPTAKATGKPVQLPDEALAATGR